MADLIERFELAPRGRRRARPGLCRPAAGRDDRGGRVCHRRLRYHGWTRSSPCGAASPTSATCLDAPRADRPRRRSPPATAGLLPEQRLCRPAALRRHPDLRADAADREPRAGSLVRRRPRPRRSPRTCAAASWSSSRARPIPAPPTRWCGRSSSAAGCVAGRDFHLAFSPEREDPNNASFTTRTIPKLVGGVTPGAATSAAALYGAVIERVVPVSSASVAEAAKLLENIYRSVNIALVNELKVLFDRMGLNVWEVIDAAATKPFGFTPFYPGPGLGGHCIPIDPFYLTWRARQFELTTRFIELAGEVNLAMPAYVVERLGGRAQRARQAASRARSPDPRRRVQARSRRRPRIAGVQAHRAAAAQARAIQLPRSVRAGAAPGAATTTSACGRCR